jgi:hypothetical protein
MVQAAGWPPESLTRRHPLLAAMWGAAAYGKGNGKGDKWGPYAGLGGFGMDPFAGKGGYGGFDGGCDGGAKGKGKSKSGSGWGQGGTGRAGGNPANSWGAEIPGFKEALLETLTEVGVTADTEDVEEILKKCESAAQKSAKKFYNDERAGTKMTGSQCKAFLGEFIEAVMGAMTNSFYDKVWFEKVAWNGALLMLVANTFANGKIFTRLLKTDIMPFIDDGLLAWSEEERVTRQFWKAVEAGGIQAGNHQKKANLHLGKAYDEAHFNTPFGSQENGSSLTPEVVMLQEFVKGWMSIFAQKAYSVLENGLEDCSPAGQSTALKAIFEVLMDPDSPCLPLSLQPSLPSAPWSYLETAATEVIAELTAGGAAA